MPSETPVPPKRKINIELLLSLSATFLSLAALIVSVFQTKIAREQQHASVWPYIAQIQSSGKDSYQFYLENKGVGPSIIKSVEWEFGDNKYDTGRDFFKAEVSKSFKGVGTSSLDKGAVFKDGETLSLIGVWNNDSLGRVLFNKLDDKAFNLRIVYSDVYGNCWERNNGEVKELKNCTE
jgi:hypothetical protein